MSDSRMFNIISRESDDGEWTELAFEKEQSMNQSSTLNNSFTAPVQPALILGTYAYKGMDISLAVLSLYEEDIDSVGLIFEIGDLKHKTHGIIFSRDKRQFAIAENRDGDVILLSHPLPDTFFDWLSDLEQNVAWE